VSFLKAEWRKLAIANYEVEASLLKEYLPAGTELDTWNGINYLSLVGFMFKNTKMLGIKIPFHINFEEVNLRFYVKHFDGKEWKRGVVFIKEIVPRFAITFVANNLYGEHYATHKMRHKWEEGKEFRNVSYEWKVNSEWQKFEVKAENKISEIRSNSEAEFITEHYWGYTKINGQQTTEYEVTHPKWDHYKVIDANIEVDFGLTYGKSFEFLNASNPKSIMLAEGSLITVEGKKKITIEKD